MKTVTYTEIEYDELDSLIDSVLEVEDFSVAADLEASNDSRSNLGTVEDMAKYNLIDWSLTHRYVYQLAKKGFIPSEYPILINICW